MELVPYTDAAAFRADVLPFLLRREAENNLMIGIIIRLADGTARWGDDPPRLFAIRDGKELIAVVTQTPPYNPIFTDAPAETIDFIAVQLHRQDLPLPGALGPKASVTRFAEQWSNLSGQRAEHGKAMRIYQLDRVSPPVVPGSAAEAGLEHLELMVQWIGDFTAETQMSQGDIAQVVRRSIEERRMLIWKDPEPVSVAACCGPTPHGIRITNVYTPPEYRCRGYASANVASLSRRLLDAGYKFCFLYADLSNPISNGIYQKIGYRPVCDVTEFRFV